MQHGLVAKQPLINLGSALVTILLVTACQGNKPVSESSPSPAPAATSPSAAPSATSLEPGTYCFKLAAKTKDVSGQLTIAPDQQVSGQLKGTINDTDAGYFTSYQREFKGTLAADKLQVAVSTRIENDVQNAVETWTLSVNQLVADRDVLSRVDCAELAEATPSPSNREPAASKPATQPTSQPTDSGDPQSRRFQVSFAPGTNASVVSNSVVRGTRDVYVLNAGADQRMRITITATEDNAVFDVIAPNGNVLEQEVTGADLYLPAAGDYEIVVGGTRGNATYEMRVQID